MVECICKVEAASGVKVNGRVVVGVGLAPVNDGKYNYYDFTLVIRFILG